ncbi:MAG TPA: ATP-binding protein [Hanamia sp.]|nr:ATP-binding protein [Hanamia sp.]
MKKILLVLSLCIMAVYMASAQAGLPPAYQILTDTATHPIALPDSNWQMMADPSGKMALEQILQSGNFQDTDRKINYHINTYWVRCRFINKMQKEINLALPEYAASVDLYLKPGNAKWQHQHTGTLVPWSMRDRLKRITTVTCIIPPGEELLIYKKAYWNYTVSTPSQIGVDFGFTKNIVYKNYVKDRTHYTNSLKNVFLIGFFLLAFVINLYFFITVREKEFLYFSLFLFFGGLLSASDLSDVFLLVHPLLLDYLASFSVIFIYFFTIHFVRYFLKTFLRFPRWDKYLILLSILQGIIHIYLQFATSVFHENLSSLNTFVHLGYEIVVNGSIFITLLLYIRKRELATRLMIIAMAPTSGYFIFVYTLLAIYNICFFWFGASAVPSFISPAIDSVRIVFDISQPWAITILAGVLFMRFSSLRKKVAMQEVEKEKERNALIAQQKIELEKQVTERTSELQQSLENLKSTQKQLIQSEKMASLGELTAGIAHEIQNPLNFVNNFSDINKELIAEMREEISKGNYNEVNEIAKDVEENAEKINHHGKRAGDIVKGMLQHSRTSIGQKELTDINALADEYLRLSYHGLRAKDKSFNAEMKTNFDESIGKISIIPQDIGRVLLNLYNNAFYAVQQKQKEVAEQGLPTFERLATLYDPTVSVTTMKSENQVTITVSDNGNGIPQNIVDKIFQPFFTTKPTGSGTGLGLSLSYDIVKAHGGEIKVESKEGEGSEFIIQLPFV